MLQQILLRYLSAPVDTATESAPQSVGIAVQSPISRTKLADELFAMLLDFIPEVAARVRLVLQGEIDESILDLIHKLHGSCSYCGVPRLQQICNTIEQLLRKGVPVAELEPEWLELLDKIENVQQAGERRANKV